MNNLTIKLIHTTDTHGCFFPFDFIEGRPCNGSMARISTYVKRMRSKYGNRLLLVDGGDILQGQPTCYYCNFVQPQMKNVAARVINFMRYDLQTIGNHDIETGHAVYDKYAAELDCDLLAANVVNEVTLKPYFKPYAIRNIEGVKIAFIGMLTPTIPYWLQKDLWSGMKFLDIPSCMAQWVKHVREVEHADAIVALFHSGFDGGIQDANGSENACVTTARNVPGVDLILCGHDHQLKREYVTNHGKEICIINPSSNAHYVSECRLCFEFNQEGTPKLNAVKAQLRNIDNENVDESFMEQFNKDIEQVKQYVSRKLGIFAHSIYTRDCFFRSAPFGDLIHDIQLEHIGADISLNAPLKFDACIRKGDVHVSDLFNLYTYENQLYVIKMTGKELKDLLEMSYGQWVTTMKSPDDHIMLMKQDGTGHWHWTNLAFNFDTAFGIDYEVDVRQNYGKKVNILRMTNGQPFCEDKTYRVAMNSYRGNGGGELLTRGAGISLKELPNRIEYVSEKDQRSIIMDYIECHKVIDAKPHNNWSFVPMEWTEPALERDYKLLFGKH